MFCFPAGLRCCSNISLDVLEPYCPINKTLVISNTGILVGEGSRVDCLSRHSLVGELDITVQPPEEELKKCLLTSRRNPSKQTTRID